MSGDLDSFCQDLRFIRLPKNQISSSRDVGYEPCPLTNMSRMLIFPPSILVLVVYVATARVGTGFSGMQLILALLLASRIDDGPKEETHCVLCLCSFQRNLFVVSIVRTRVEHPLQSSTSTPSANWPTSCASSRSIREARFMRACLIRA